MISRRHFVQAAMATTALYGASGFGNWSRLAAQQVLSQDDLIGSSDFGNVSLIHITDMHAQTQPIYFREPEFNIGVGLAEGQPPHLVGDEFRAAYGIEKGSAMDYALTYDDFTSLAQGYGRMGGLDRISTVVKAIRAAAARCAPAGWRRHVAGVTAVAQDAGYGHGHADERAGR
jgi:sulfur-oxidizing protein SoxB